MMNAQQIIETINASWLEHYGLRADTPDHKIGEALDNSHQWYQDWQEYWGDMPEDDYNADPEHPYNTEIGCWDDGELDGTCSIGLPHYNVTVEAVEEALNLIDHYLYGSHSRVYLIGGDYAEGGNDIGELIIRNAEVVAIVA